MSKLLAAKFFIFRKITLVMSRYIAIKQFSSTVTFASLHSRKTCFT